MKVSAAAFKPYARALHDLAKERGQTEAVDRDLQAMVDLLQKDTELREFFSRPWVSASARRAAALEVAARLELSPLMRDFVGLVARSGRAQHLDAIAAAYRDMVDEDLGRVRARVRTPVPLTESEREALRTRLGRVMGGKQVIMNEDVDAKLLGGFVAEIGSYIVDGSLDAQLARIGERLKQSQN
jgi:F-type H+-transporting ATPase subunit delta